MKLFDDAAVDRKFRRMQWRMLFATMIGYTLFYFMRKNFSFAMPGLQQDCGISKSMLGNFLFWGGIVYGLSKFVNGIVGDRVGPRKMLCLGLLACTMVNVAFGFAPQIAAMLGNGERECCFSLDVRTASRPQSVLPGDWFPAVCEADRVLDTAEGACDEDVRLEHVSLGRRRTCREDMRRHHGTRSDRRG